MGTSCSTRPSWIANITTVFVKTLVMDIIAKIVSGVTGVFLFLVSVAKSGNRKNSVAINQSD